MNTQEPDREMNTESQVRNQLKKKLRNQRIRRVITWVVVIAILVGAFQSYSFYKTNGHLPWAKAKAPVTTVKESEAKVYESSFTNTIDLSGYVEPNDIQSVILRSTGTVTDVFVKEGDSVKKGDVLIAIDNTNQLYDVASIKADIEKAKLNGSERDLELLELKLKSATNKLDYTQAYANFDGVVASVKVSEGDYFEAGSSAMTIIDRSKLKATVEIDEIDMQHIKIGQKAELVFDSYTDGTLEGEVTYIPMIGKYTSQGIGVMEVEITIANPPASIAPGYTFEGTITSEGETVLTLLPQSALTVGRGGVTTVTKKLADGKTQTVIVTVKYLGEGISQLLTGDLKVGDTLIIRKTDTNASAFSAMSSGGRSPAGGIMRIE
ncbi:efflux RND transporter periplasmic adaptor subunit [Sphaerochaeta sp. PS]|uniref:efflux RND transporter periplasmic adaptor subunit n=1 Tax=Sphaerochaeta sp. PS TaxID=3076336 RepID=UPI0028A3044E|nr:efflux RND transporter periplasmic adaptor subunit [Sphaerochaeta sp. PS]MDT4761891.1 efflux RND transporter periplasmic adaptor subunit [Sphaerochaeta sp. PS]